jgi:uncharacterized protein YbjQ (UPF0145 family)
MMVAMTDHPNDVLITTTDRVEGRSVVRYLGPVFAEHVHAPGWLRGLADDVRHAFDARSEEFDTDLLESRAAVVRELRRHAEELKAHAVVATRFEVEELRGGVVATLAHGTAVQLDLPAPGGWVVDPPGRGDHPIVEELRRGGHATLAELSARMDADLDWLDITLSSLEEAGAVVMDDEGRWRPADS